MGQGDAQPRTEFSENSFAKTVWFASNMRMTLRLDMDNISLPHRERGTTRPFSAGVRRKPG